MPTPRSEIQAAVADGRIYVAGGFAMGSRIVAAFEAYDPQTDSWERLAPLPRRIHHAALAALDGRVYLSGGYRGLNMSVGTTELAVFDPAENRWQALADMPAPRAAHVMVAHGDHLYVLGGITEDLASVWRYDPAGDSWEAGLPRMPTAREHLAAAVIDDDILVVGGRLHGNQATLEAFDTATGAWRSLPPMPTPRGGLTAVAVAGRLHVTGGEAFNPPQTFEEHEVFDPASGSWETLAPLPSARHGLASVALDGSFYVIGGATLPGAGTFASVTTTVHIFDPEE